MIREGTRVRWPWGDGHAEGTVQERHESRVTRTIEGNQVVRDGSASDPALVIEQDDGQAVLKLESELERADAS